MRKKKEYTTKELKEMLKAKKAEEAQSKPKEKAPKYPTTGLIKDYEDSSLFVNDIRILTPKEYKAIREVIPKKKHKYMFDILMITGMRYIEYLRFFDHKEWYSGKRKLIHLPEEAVKKAERTMPERNIVPLPIAYFEMLLENFDEKPPLQDTWSKNLRRWAKKAGINPYGISAKTTRKTIESWMITTGIDESKVCKRQGHDVLTSMKHYQDLGFSEEERSDIKRQLEDWNFIERR